MSKVAPDVVSRPAFHSSRCAREQNSSALGQNSAMAFAQDSSGSHPTAELLGPALPDEDLDRPPARAALGSPDRLGPDSRRDTHDVVGAPGPQLDAVEDEAVTCPSRREAVHAHDCPVVHLGHPDRYDEVDGLAGPVGG